MIYVKVFVFISLGIGFLAGSISGGIHGFGSLTVAALYGGPAAGICAVIALALVRNLSKKRPRFGDVSHTSELSLNLPVEDAFSLCKASLAEIGRPHRITYESATDLEIAAVLEPAGQHTTKDKVTLKVDQQSDDEARVIVHSQPRSWPVVWDNNSNLKNIRKISEYIERHAN